MFLSFENADREYSSHRVTKFSLRKHGQNTPAYNIDGNLL
jgi:hypothetical protein